MNEGCILVVDDEPQIRRVLRSALVSAGYEVADARNGEVAVEMTRAGKYDLLLLDINMPGMDGLETCRKVRSSSDISIIILNSEIRR
jgi:DNA-binding response OmpR family regulator